MNEAIQTPVNRAQDRLADSQLRRSWAKLKRNKAAVFGGILILIYVFTALLAPVIFPRSPSAPDLDRSLEGPSLKHPLGTDELGRSILGRIIHGSRVSLLIAIGVVSSCLDSDPRRPKVMRQPGNLFQIGAMHNARLWRVHALICKECIHIIPR